MNREVLDVAVGVDLGNKKKKNWDKTVDESGKIDRAWNMYCD